MFANDLTGLCRNNLFGADINTQIPTGVNTLGNVPFNWGLGAYNVMGQYFHPAYGAAYGSIFNRLPQTIGQSFVPGFVPTYGQNYGQNFGQNFGHTFGQGVGQSFGQGFGQAFPTFGQVNTPYFQGVTPGVSPVMHNVPFNSTLANNPIVAQNQILAHNQILANALALAYGITPSTVANWTNPLVQSGICR